MTAAVTYFGFDGIESLHCRWNASLTLPVLYSTTGKGTDDNRKIPAHHIHTT